jgi:hypothetical protein
LSNDRLKKELMGTVAYRLPGKKKLSPRRLSDLALVIIVTVVTAAVLAVIHFI